MPRSFLLMMLLILATTAGAQGRWYTKTGVVRFLSKAPLENIEAVNNTVTAVLEPATGAIQFAVQMKGFAFRKALMQAHFNENYVESDKYPKATYKGAFLQKNEVDYGKEGTYEVKVKGKLTLHGVTREMEAPASIRIDGGKIWGRSSFNINLSDYNIAIPALVKDKLSNNILVTVDLDLEPLK